MTITETPATDKPTEVSARGKKGRIQAITIDDQTIHVSELESLSERPLDPRVQERMRSAFGILRHRKPTMIDRMLSMLRRHSFN
jgi:hypothetical protein